VKKGFFLIIFAGFITEFTSTLAVAEPGCWSVIQGKSINEKLAKKLPPSCQSFRKIYLSDLELLSQSKKKFSQNLIKRISAKKSFDPPYDELLISTFVSNLPVELKQTIEKRAQIEREKKFHYQYAAAALERIEKGSCTSKFKAPAYTEICQGTDQVYARIEKLSEAKQ
jgi:hypothetical protein